MKRCYVLGAGFSKACGLPLASELMAAVWNYRNDSMSSYGPPNWSATIQQQRDFIQSLYPTCDLRSNWPDFEDLLTVLDEWDEYRQACDAKRDSFVAGFRESLMRHLHGLLCEQTAAAQAANKLQAVQEFVREVHEEESVIVSFNWDLLIEIAAQNIGVGIQYEKNAAGSKIVMAKPHGSLNLAEVQKAEWNRWKNPQQRPINIVSLDVECEESDPMVV